MTNNMHTMQFMADVSIVGAAGYTGQETLDRVLGHPQLRLVAAGSDSLAGRAASVLDPRLAGAGMPAFVTNEEALAHDPNNLYALMGLIIIATVIVVVVTVDAVDGFRTAFRNSRPVALATALV